ncbi:hypothetical protein A0H81_03554 [Grifola frondosa]|uniref:Uncharacterized protein n=1 Tax=Grifola frondosa TaxID=5627 RepID=A0A1C7MHX8_GRIFR|nr:hypothetical protein A0H81_03554 [Grifola frondosa]
MRATRLIPRLVATELEIPLVSLECASPNLRSALRKLQSCHRRSGALILRRLSRNLYNISGGEVPSALLGGKR